MTWSLFLDHSASYLPLKPRPYIYYTEILSHFLLARNMPAISCYQYSAGKRHLYSFVPFLSAFCRASTMRNITTCHAQDPDMLIGSSAGAKLVLTPGHLTCQNLTMWSMVSWAWGHQGGDWSSHLIVDAATNIANNISPGQTHPKAQSRAQFSLWVGTLPVAAFVPTMDLHCGME